MSKSNPHSKQVHITYVAKPRVLHFVRFVLFRALQDITPGPEVRQILKVRAVRKPDVFLTGPDTLISKKKSKKIPKKIFPTFPKKIFFIFFSIFYISLLILSMSIFYTKFVYWEDIISSGPTNVVSFKLLKLLYQVYTQMLRHVLRYKMLIRLVSLCSHCTLPERITHGITLGFPFSIHHRNICYPFYLIARLSISTGS